jgi:hypothetical protein
MYCGVLTPGVPVINGSVWIVFGTICFTSANRWLFLRGVR